MLGGEGFLQMLKLNVFVSDLHIASPIKPWRTSEVRLHGSEPKRNDLLFTQSCFSIHENTAVFTMYAMQWHVKKCHKEAGALLWNLGALCYFAHLSFNVSSSAILRCTGGGGGGSQPTMGGEVIAHPRPSTLIRPCKETILPFLLYCLKHTLKRYLCTRQGERNLRILLIVSQSSH